MIVVTRGGGFDRRPVGVLRRGAVPHGRAAVGAGDQRRRARRRPHADRRRRGRLLLDARRTPPRRRSASTARRPRDRLRHAARRLDACGRAAVLRRARELGGLSRAPRDHLDRHRARPAPEGARAAGQRPPRRRRAGRLAAARRRRRPRSQARRGRGVGLRRSTRTSPPAPPASNEPPRRSPSAARAALAKHTAALFAHDPERTLERGYALLLDEHGEPLPDARAVREAGSFTARMADADVPARVRGMSTPESYEAAVERLEQIIARLDTGQAGLRETLDLCREGQDADRLRGRRARGGRQGPRGAPPRRPDRTPRGGSARRSRSRLREQRVPFRPAGALPSRHATVLHRAPGSHSCRRRVGRA